MNLYDRRRHDFVDEDWAAEAERMAGDEPQREAASPYRGRDDDPGGPDDMDMGAPSMTRWQHDLDDEAMRP